MVDTAESIDEVIDQLDDIIIWAKVNRSSFGYFAALYRKVTVQVKTGIEQGAFEDGPRMERLDIIFANRYIDAFYQYRSGQIPSASWLVAFDTGRDWWPIVLQHLLLGMNAHINLDLGIAAAQTSPGEQLPELKNDFNRINETLATLVGGVQEELARIWPLLGLMNRFLGSVEETVINFSMEKARDAAWEFAEQLAPLQTAQQLEKISLKDQKIATFAKVVRYPGVLGGVTTKIIRLGERGSIVERIEVLA